MDLKGVIKKFEERPVRMSYGAGKMSKRFNCTMNDIYEARRIVRILKKNEHSKIKHLPKILIFDIETAPLRAYVWSRWQQNVYLDQTISEWFMLTWSAKWLGSTETLSNRLVGSEVKAEDDYRIVKDLWRLINEADIIIAHHGDKFDVPKMNSRFIINGLNPPSSYITIDTRKVAARQFGFSSNKLDALAGYFGFDCKLDTDFKLWSKCMDGDEDSLKYMEKYNKYDVELLEDVYLKLRPWIKPHPNVSLYSNYNEPQCATCGSLNVKDEGFYYTSTGKYPTYRCDCGAISRGRTTIVEKDKKKSLLVSSAR